MTETISYVFVDESIQGDNRVGEALKGRESIKIINIVEPGERFSAGDRLYALWLMLRSLASGAAAYRRIRKSIQPYRPHAFFGGMKGCWRWMLRMAAATRRLRRGPPIEENAHLHGNDLYCVAAAALLAPASASVVYDSHEIQFHRNRKNGWLRMLIEIGLERRALRRAEEIYVVNHEVGRLLTFIHGAMPKITIRYNDFYRHHPIPEPPKESAPALLYVGKGLRGRMLEALDKPAAETGADLFIYTLGAPLPEHLSGAHWRFGPTDYEADLLAVARSRRCLMWCCHEDVCLSYKLALPNKFFQSLAIGAPIVASKGVYVAEIVESYGIGAVFDGTNLAEILERARGGDFDRWRETIAGFRDAVRSGEIRL